MEHDERAYSAYWEKMADEMGGDRLKEGAANNSVIVPKKYEFAYREGIENHFKKQLVREKKADQERVDREKNTLELAEEANRIAKQSRREMRYTWAAAVLIAFLTFVFTFLLEGG